MDPDHGKEPLLAGAPSTPLSSMPIATAMPTAPPLSSLTNTYSMASNTPSEEHSPPPLDDHEIPTAHATPLSYFSPDQLAQLATTAPPVDHFSTNLKFSSHPVGASRRPTKSDSGPIPTPNAPSLAEAHYDGMKGVHSHDPLLHMDLTGEEIRKYLETHNTRPRLATRVHGYHNETRTRTVTRQVNGESKTETERYNVTVTDFDYKVDLTPFIFPFGFIQTDNGNDITDEIQAFLGDSNGLKKLTMEKVVDFDYQALQRMVYGHVRSMGWHRGLSVTFPRANYRCKVWKKNCLSSCWESCLGRCLCYASLVGCCVMNYIVGQHKQSHIKSYFRIEYDPLQVMEMIKGRLWCPGRRAQAIHMIGELYRDDVFSDDFW